MPAGSQLSSTIRAAGISILAIPYATLIEEAPVAVTRLPNGSSAARTTKPNTMPRRTTALAHRGAELWLALDGRLGPKATNFY
jgi:hypothetical protein